MREMLLKVVSTAILIVFVSLSSASYLRAQSDAAKLFKTNCALCHGEDGSGNTPSGKALKAKDLKSEEVQKQTDAELAAMIAQGKGKMPAFGKKLKPEQINQLVAYMRELPKNK